jgi:hypothetical protein
MEIYTVVEMVNGNPKFDSVTESNFGKYESGVFWLCEAVAFDSLKELSATYPERQFRILSFRRSN